MRARAAAAFALALCLLCASHARADDDPEPPDKGGALLRQLKGKWTVTRRVLRGKETKGGGTLTYEFDGDKVTVDTGSMKYTATVKVDAKKKPAVLELTREGAKAPTRSEFKIEKGELYLVPVPKYGLGVVEKEEDAFKGETRPLMVLKREKM
jgi:uncharacterized protein (TIGR03067 family)